MSNAASNKLQTYEKLFFVLLFAVIAFGFLSDFFTAPEGQLRASLIVTFIKWLPVALLTPALLKGKPNNYIWLAYLLIPYFCWAVLKGFSPELVGKLGAGEAVFIALLFSLAISCARWKKAL